MLEIYINKQKLDDTASIDIALSLTDTDFSNPQSIKTSYSKTFTVKGTKNNNKIFGLLFDVRSNATGKFNTANKATCIIKNDGLLVDEGFVTLDSVNISNSEYNYNCTFYSGLNDFFYRLKYIEEADGKVRERKFSDFNFGLTKFDSSFNEIPINENSVLFDWNAENISEGWKFLCGDYHNDDATINPYKFDHYTRSNIWIPSNLWMSNITGAPVYNGLQDDFDSSKILVYMPEDDLGEIYKQKTQSSERAKFDMAWNNTKIQNKGWFLFDMPRDLTDWELPALNSSNIRPAIRTKWLLDNIAKPENNGGWNIEWPESFKLKQYGEPEYLEGQYYNLTWTLLPHFKFEETTQDIQVNWNPYIDGENVGHYNVEYNGSTTININTFNNPKINLKIVGSFNIPADAKPEQYSQYLKFNYYYKEGIKVDINNFVLFTCKYKNVYGQEATKKYVLMDYDPHKLDNWNDNRWALDYWRWSLFGDHLDQFFFDDVTFISTVDYPFEKTDNGQYTNIQKPFNIYIDNIEASEETQIEIEVEYISAKCKRAGETSLINFSREYNPKNLWLWNNNVVETKEPGDFWTPQDMAHKYLSQNPDCDISNLVFAQNYFKDWRKIFIQTIYRGGTGKVGTKFNPSNTNVNFAATEDSYIYDNIQNIIQKTHVTKDVLCSNLPTPIDFLLSFCKLLNLRFIFKDNKTIQIIEGNKFYNGDIKNIDKLIDVKNIDIQFNYLDNKEYNLSLKNSNNYIETLYKKKYNNTFQDTSKNSISENLSGTSNVFDNNVFSKSGLYNQSSVYYGKNYISYIYPDIKEGEPGLSSNTLYASPLLKGNKTTINLSYNGLNDTNYDVWFNLNNKYSDYFRKSCMFDKDNKTTNELNLMFFNAPFEIMRGEPYRTADEFALTNRIYVYDNIPVMYELSDKACHIDFCSSSEYGTTVAQISLNTDEEKKLAYTNYMFPYFSPYMISTLTDGSVEKSSVLSFDNYLNTFESKLKAVYSTNMNNDVFNSDSSNTSDGLIDISEVKNITDLFLDKQYNEMLDPNNRKVTCNVMLNELHVNNFNDYIRNLYYFDNSVWRLNKITDYSVTSKKTCKCEFIQVQDINNLVYEQTSKPITLL